MLDVHTGLLLGQLSSRQLHYPIQWELPPAARFALLLLRTCASLTRNLRLAGTGKFSVLVSSLARSPRLRVGRIQL
jgi:hypothetical protein